MEQHPDLLNLLKAARERRNFKVDEWIDQKTDMLNEYMKKCGLKACVVSVSGGIDSACTLGICLAAKAKPGSPIEKVLGIAQPIKSTASIWQRALECRETMGADIVVVDQTEIFPQLASIVETATGIAGEPFAQGQLKSYMRTPVGYYAAQLISQAGQPCIVMGTGNFDEDGYLCYFCKAGDGIVDVQVIADLHKSEVFEVSRKLKAPESILNAAPSADLWEGQTDEEELGFSYDFIELYTEYLRYSEEDQAAFKAKCNEAAWKYFTETREEVDKVHRRNQHKLNFPVNLNILPTFAE
mmetsp:Transcript_11152/g.45415  ORF Transcript_11152/g.45415 Transcript_11152/m.45415 type:complete len:298 (-) Transcript_11152:94-987(-)|eukprot:CAMPEP_0114626068 /NCGR_PEP_ID=MMETSP0168-20121206/11590_1 /TAXON_ID=95228 ORGANISM="Vannella sp., Strain DIVA3 517/6/12" /NCGR_SAMPLE_ID=MMETSP0168 /ASSEMBLY_ACC=CAM_ASM_000044 /LENGTH=297 /DNA_ID=CAMNT_0001837359 /DNA_START=27 /DNA_END=920 /DNA_ORIENTATION=+